MDRDDLEKQYNNRLSIPDAQDYNVRAVKWSEAARAELKSELGLAYGDSARERIDVFPAAAPGAPMLVFIHGGYWRARVKEEFHFVARPFVQAGITVAFPEYDLAPAVSVTHIVRQMVAAHAWLWRNARRLGADPARICVAGHSAGGHLAAMMLAHDWRAAGTDLPADLVKAALAISGVFDLAPLMQVSFNSEMRIDETVVREASPVHRRPARAAPLHTAVGAKESDEFRRQVRLVREAWPQCEGESIDLEGHHHLSIVEALADPASPLFGLARRMIP